MILIDTDVLIDLRSGHRPTVEHLEALFESGEDLGTTSINAAELLRGAHGDRAALAKTVELLDRLTEVPFGPRAARRFARVLHQLDRAGQPIPAVDGLVAAAALEAGAPLMTRNVRHFDRVAGLEVLVPGRGADGEAEA